MSGIAGISYLDGRPAQQETIDTMVGAMAHRGPDGIHTWREGSVAIGHCMLHTTPESLHDNLPMQSRDGNLVLTADARIDNREDLIRTLRLKPYRDAPLTDCDLILAAYQKWGKECPKHLLGAFAFAIWDKREQRLFCSRDHFGVKPLYYSFSDALGFIFATELVVVRKCLGRRLELDSLRIADYFNQICLSKEYTFFREIKRLPPAHTVTMRKNRQPMLKEYWRLDPKPEFTGRSVDDVATGVAEYLKTAIDDRMRNCSGVASELSGGLDSSTVSALATRPSRRVSQDVSLFSSSYPSLPSCDETAFVDAVARHIELPVRYVRGDTCSAFDNEHKITEWLGQPFVAPHAFANLPRLQAIAETGTRVLLSGHGGDETISRGTGYIRELAVENKIARLFLVLLILDIRNKDLNIFYKKYIISIYKGMKRNDRESMPSKIIFRIVRYVALYMSHKNKRVTHKLISDNLNKKYDIDDRVRAYYDMFYDYISEQERHLSLWTNPMPPLTFETMDVMHGRLCLEKRFPFFDRRLVEYCLQVPANMKLRYGYQRWILRRAVGSHLPAMVRWRTSKVNFHPNLQRSYKEGDAAKIEAAVDRQKPDVYTDIGKVEELLRKSSKGVNNTLQLTMAFAVARWYFFRGSL